jgi:integrase
MDLAYPTAQRIGGLIEITLSDINEKGIAFRQNKTGKKLLVKMTPELNKAIERIHQLPHKIGSLVLFHTQKGRSYTYAGVSVMFRRAVKASGVKDFHFHDLRAKALTDAKKAGLDSQKLAGHATEKMTAHYIKRREIEEATPLPRTVL